MKNFSVGFAIVFGIALSVQPVQAQDIPATGSEVDNAVAGEVMPEGNVEEELPILEEGEEVPVLEEGEGDGVTERGIRLRKFRKIPKQKKKVRRPFRLKRLPKQAQPPGNTPPSNLPDPVDPPLQCVWHTSDIIDQRIDISAQKRLMHMMSRGGEERRDASAMIGAVKQGALAGILLAPRKAVSDRGQRMTPPKGWWELIPQGQLGTCLQEPFGEPPMMLYRDKMGEVNLDPSVIDHTLRTMWGQCGLPTPVPACSYLVDLHKPPPQPGSTDEQPEGSGELQVFVTGSGQSLSGVQVTVIANRKEPQGTTFVRTAVTNSEGVAHFFLPPLGKGIQVHATGPPGFLNSSHVVTGFFVGKRLMIELSPIEDPSS